MRTGKAFVGAALVACLVLPACTKVVEPEEAEQSEIVHELTPAVIAMRWQWLNPEINSFTFRETKDVFEYRDVRRGDEVWDLPRGEAMRLPGDYDAFAERTFTNAMLVIRKGEIVFEDYRNRMLPGTRHVAFSMSKTITALLTGIALDKGEIASLDDRADTYVPQLKGTGYEGVTIRQILQMRSGVDYEERYDFGDNPSFAGRLHEQAIVLNRQRFADGALETTRANEPGSTFNYSTLDTMVLGWVLEEATGLKLEQQMEQRIWQKLGAEADGFWLADGPPGNGRALNGMGFNATLRDFGRLGLLMANDGMRGDQRIIPEGWMRQVTAMLPTGAPAGQGFPGYGHQTWQVDSEPGAYAAVGLAGQFIYVHPASDTVIVKLSYYPPVEPPGLDAEVLAMFKAIAKER
ncbi:MAG TPA: serine hydrolase [Sphingomonadaceae bacterium]|nr:serine hydrolase [Sphingomonadaceae bacterium]